MHRRPHLNWRWHCHKGPVEADRKRSGQLGAFQVNPWVAAGACTGVIFSAVYALSLYRKVALGPIENPKLAGITDINPREWLMFVPLVIFTLWLGLAPTMTLDFTAPAIARVVQQFGGVAP